VAEVILHRMVEAGPVAPAEACVAALAGVTMRDIARLDEEAYKALRQKAFRAMGPAFRPPSGTAMDVDAAKTFSGAWANGCGRP
jgi:hypothetical protein